MGDWNRTTEFSGIFIGVFRDLLRYIKRVIWVEQVQQIAPPRWKTGKRTKGIFRVYVEFRVEEVQRIAEPGCRCATGHAPRGLKRALASSLEIFLPASY